ncbi:MAG: hypothetical protein WAW37_13035 [Syntrophobacteraceae bacterium]
MRLKRFIVWILAICFFVGPGGSLAAQSVRVIPKGALSVFQDGKEIGQFTSEIPLPDGQMACRGTCVVHGPNFQLVAHNKAEFSLVQRDKSWVLNVKSGRVDFALREGVDLIFECPDGVYNLAKVVPSKSHGLTRGSVAVNSAGTVFTGSEGEFQVAGAGELRTITPGSISGLSGTAAQAAVIGVPILGLAGLGALGLSPKSRR